MQAVISLQQLTPVPTKDGIERKARQIAELTGDINLLTEQIKLYCPQVPGQDVKKSVLMAPWTIEHPVGSDFQIVFLDFK